MTSSERYWVLHITFMGTLFGWVIILEILDGFISVKDYDFLSVAVYLALLPVSFLLGIKGIYAQRRFNERHGLDYPD